MLDTTTVYREWGLRCPKCGSDASLVVEVVTGALLTADGTDVLGDQVWGDESDMVCSACGMSGKVSDFRVRKCFFTVTLASGRYFKVEAADALEAADEARAIFLDWGEIDASREMKVEPAAPDVAMQNFIGMIAWFDEYGRDDDPPIGDAVDTLNSLIRSAREIMGECP